MIKYYKLNGKVAVACHSLLEWAEWFETAERRVASEDIAGIWISTVFLGLDHNYSSKGDPLLFETMTFSPEGEANQMRRYFTWEEAEQGHKQVADLVRAEAMEADLDAADVISQVMLKMSYGK